jgi:hypothetical protein
MGQGPELSELQQRVEAVGVRFGEVAEDSRQRGERLASLLGQVEKGVVRGRHEVDRLKQALAEAREENAQILALLETLLAMAEKVDGPGERIVLCDLEARVDRLHDQAASMNGAVDSSLKAERKSSKSGNGSLDAEALKEDSQEDPQEDPQEDGTGGSEWEPVPDEEAGDEDGSPLELTRMIAEDGEMKDLGSSPAGVVESGGVQDIFKRVSMITGRLRET